jgi:hypothetical protein
MILVEGYVAAFSIGSTICVGNKTLIKIRERTVE